MKLLWVYFDIGTGNPVHYNHGVGFVDASLRAAGHQTALVYYRNEPSEKDAIEVLARERPDIVLFPINTHQWMFARPYSAWVKKHSRALTIAGGIHAILDPESVIAQPTIDAVCTGEGEYALVELLDALAGRGAPDQVDGFHLRLPSGAIARGRFRPLIEDLDALPISDREIWDHEAAIRETGYELAVMGGRGCPFNCTYCANSARREVYRGHGRFVRMCSPRYLIEMIARLEKRYAFSRVFIEDDVFIFKHQWAEEFCALYRERFRYPFQAYVRVEFCTKEILRTMKEAGCYRILIGVEAGNERLRAEMLNRRMTNDDIVRVFRWADELDLQTWNFNMLGFPGETPETVADLFALNRRIRPNRAQISLFYPYPKTRLHEVCVEQGLIVGDERPTYFEKSILALPTIPREALEAAFWDFRKMALEIRAEKEARGYFDFAARFPEAAVESDAPEPPRLHLVTLNGLEEMTIFQHPRGTITYRADVAPGSVLRTKLALDPVCYGWGGAGVRFRITAQNGRGAHEILNEYLDPKSDPTQRRWHPVEIALDNLAGRDVRFVFRTEPNEAGDLVGAWSVWGRPHLALREPYRAYGGARR